MKKHTPLALAAIIALLAAACLEPITVHTVVVNVNDAAMGSAEGGGLYTNGATATLSATPNQYYSFTRWDDGNTDNPREVTVKGDATYTAIFNVAVNSSDPDPVPTPVPIPDPNPNDTLHGFGCYGASYSLFSVSSTKRVHFSRGNLQYQASTNTWRFAEHQYLTCGMDNAYISATNSSWIDLFGWGTSGWNSGATCYQPYSTSQDGGDYTPGNDPNANLTGTYAEADWAWHNAIVHGGNVPHYWRTLTAEEWKYLIEGRPNASNKVGYAFVAEDDGAIFFSGVVILPDNFVLPSGLSFVPGFGLNDNLALNTYSLGDWERMEINGAVFLPTTGARMGTDVRETDGRGFYWSTTNNGSDAKHFSFTLEGYFCPGNGSRYDGQAVRPVHDE